MGFVLGDHDNMMGAAGELRCDGEGDREVCMRNREPPFLVEPEQMCGDAAVPSAKQVFGARSLGQDQAGRA